MGMTRAKAEAKKYVASLLEEKLNALRYAIRRRKDEMKRLAFDQEIDKRMMAELAPRIRAIRKELAI